jgi:PAS domain S-box-containing protein
MTASDSHAIGVCLALTNAISHTTSVREIYEAALDALRDGLGVERSSILLFDPDGVMRFKAWRGLSDAYRSAVEGHTPWRPDTRDASTIVVADVSQDPSLSPLLAAIEAEGLAAMTFVPLISLDRVIGKFMLYSNEPRDLTAPELTLAGVIAAQVAFAVQRTVAEEAARLSEERLRFALEAASMGTWEWDLATDIGQWSDNLERVHGLPRGSFDGTFTSYARWIHPDDCDAVMAATKRAVETGTLYDVEYRVVAPDGSARWIVAKGRVECTGGRPARMSGVFVDVTRRKQAEISSTPLRKRTG